MYSTPLDTALSEAAVRLLESLLSPVDAQILGPQIVREITYRILCGNHGDALRALVALNGRLGQVQRALERMHANYSQPLDVTSLANEAGMSVSAFHHNFKAITATSPLQYLKTIRLHKARMLMVQEGAGAGVAADRVGYESTSQFSREFRRFFGTTPLDEASRIRAMLGLDSPAVARIE
jgi:transcriptional regulator GlxA family with amidase domain